MIQLQVGRLTQDPAPKKQRLEVWIPTRRKTNDARADDGEDDDPQAQLEREMAELVRPESSGQRERREPAATHGGDEALFSDEFSMSQPTSEIDLRKEAGRVDGEEAQSPGIHDGSSATRVASMTSRSNPPALAAGVTTNGTRLGHPSSGRPDTHIRRPVVVQEPETRDRTGAQGLRQRHPKRTYEDALGVNEAGLSATHTRNPSPPKRQRQDARHSLAGNHAAAAAAAARTPPIRPQGHREASPQAPRAHSVPTARVARQVPNVPARRNVVVEQIGPSEDGSVFVEDDSILLEPPSIIDPTQEIALTGGRIAKMYKLMGKSGWTNNGAGWEKDFRLDRVSQTPIQISSHDAPPSTKIGKRCWVHLVFLENLIRRMPKFNGGEESEDDNGLRAQNTYIQEHESQVKNSVMTVNQFVVKICEKRLGVLSDSSDEANDNIERRHAMVDDLVRFLVPKLVCILREAFAVGGVEKDDIGSGSSGFFSCSTLDFLVRTAGWIWRLSRALDNELLWRPRGPSIPTILSQASGVSQPPEDSGGGTVEQSIREASRARATARKMETAKKRLEQQKRHGEQAARERDALRDHIVAFRRSIKDAIGAAEEEARGNESEEQKRRRAQEDEKVIRAREAAEERERQRALRQHHAFCAWSPVRCQRGGTKPGRLRWPRNRHGPLALKRAELASTRALRLPPTR